MHRTGRAPEVGYVGEELDLRIRRGATFGPIEIAITDSAGVAHDASGWTFRAQMRKKASAAGAPAGEFTFDVTQSASGRVFMSMPASSTLALLAGEVPEAPESVYVWSAECERPDGSVHPLFYGKVRVWNDPTIPPAVEP